ncbi:MAG: threonine ammonia-lyase [Actinomycetia bacterium]|nr:threonine ammonia-lyase [Actinomycetes bacterium]
MTDLTVSQIREAARGLRYITRVTPVIRAHWLEMLAGGPVYLKCENLQRSGSFKLRGAYTRISRLSEQERSRGVVAASAGNHAQGVALAAADLGVSATVFMPRSASLPKVAATADYGATVELVGESVEAALAAAAVFAAETGAVMVHPFDHPDVVLGQGTVGLEIAEQVPAAKSVVVPVGGGGLLAGTALALKGTRPNTEVFGVQAKAVAPMAGSLAARKPVPWQTPTPTMADGIAVTDPGVVPVSVAATLVTSVVDVTEAELADGMLQTLERGKLVAEPAGVAGVAALLAEPDRFPTPAVIVISGGNVDPLLLNKVINRGLAAAGRFVSITVRMTDVPGSLARLLTLLAQAEANVLDVNHQRSDPSLNIGEVRTQVGLEMRGPAQRDELFEALAASGYDFSSRDGGS